MNGYETYMFMLVAIVPSHLVGDNHAHAGQVTHSAAALEDIVVKPHQYKVPYLDEDGNEPGVFLRVIDNGTALPEVVVVKEVHPQPKKKLPEAK